MYSPAELAAAISIIVAAGIVRGFTGFGAGLVAMPLLTLMWSPVEALATNVLLGIAATAQLAPQAARTANWRDMGPMTIAIVLATPVGVWLLVTLDPGAVKKAIAVFVLIATLLTLYGWTYRGPRGAVPAAAAGGIGGIVNGLAGVGGPPMVLYLISLPESPETHRANIVMSLASTGVVSLIAMGLAGAFSIKIAVNAAILLGPSILAVWVGARLFRVLPARMFRLVILWFLVAISVAMLLA